MNINNIQTNYIKEKIIKLLAKNGVKITTYEVNNMINDYYLNYEKGTPLFKPLNIKKYTTSNKEEYNKAFTNLDIDLDVLYKAVKELKKEIIIKEDDIDNKKTTLLSNLRKLQLKADILTDTLTNKYNYYSKSFTFNDFNNIRYCEDELQNLSKNNIPLNTAFINLKSKNAHSNLTKCEKINYEDANITIYNTGELLECNNNIKGIYNNQNEDYYYIKTKGKDIKNSIQITIEFIKPVNFSLIKINTMSIQNIIGTVTIYTKDDFKYNLYDINFNEYAEWNFDYSDITSIDIKLSKSYPDEINDKNNYFTYIIKNISLYNAEYEKDSILITKDIQFDKIFESIKLYTDNTIIQNSSISYLLGVNTNNNKPVTWISQNNNKEFDLNYLLDEKEDIFNNKTYKYGDEINNDCYVIGTIEDNICSSSFKILNGYQQWNVKVLQKPNFDSNYRINIEDYDEDYIVDEVNLDCESYKLDVDTNSLIVFTTYVYCKDITSSKGHYINVYKTPEHDYLNYEYVVYVNNVKIDCNSLLKYDITFSKGKNKVVILAYIKHKNIDDNEKDKNSIELIPMNINFNFKNATLDIASGNTMKRVSPNELHNIDSNNYNYYAITNDNVIITNYNLRKRENHSHIKLYTDGSYIYDYNYQDYMRYYIKYKKLKDKYVDDYIINNEIKFNFILAALFHSDSNKVTSRLTSYSLLGK